MRASDFIKEYNAAILEKDNSITVRTDSFAADDFDFMDVFDDVDTIVDEPDSDSDLLVDDFGFVEESSDLIIEDKMEESIEIDKNVTRIDKNYLQSVEIYGKTEESAENSIKDAFFNDLYEDDYDVLNDDVVATFNQNFNLHVKTALEAYQYYLLIYYGIQISTSDISDNSTLFNRNVLQKAKFPYRNVTIGEIQSISMYGSEEWFNPVVLFEYSFESRDTNLLIDLMKNGLFNKEEAEMYVQDLNVFNAYLRLKCVGMYNDAFSQIVLNGVDSVLAYVDACINSGYDVSKIATRDDFSKIYNLLIENYSDNLMELMNTYSESPWLYQICVASVNGLYNKVFIDNYLIDDSALGELIANDYADGKLDKELLVYSEYNYYVARVLSDLRRLGISVESLEFVREQKMELLKTFSEKILISYNSKSIDFGNYQKYVLLLALPQSTNMVEKIMSFFTGDVESFNVFWMELFLKRFNMSLDGVLDIGDVIMIYTGGRGGAIYYSVQDLFCRVNSVTESVIKNDCHQMFINEYGIIFAPPGIEQSSINVDVMQKYYGVPTSFSYYLTDGSSKDNKFTKLYPSLKILESNLISPLQRYAGITDNTVKLANSLTNYLDYDRVVALINADYAELFGVLNSSCSAVCIQLLKKIVILNRKSYVHLNFFHMLFTVVFKNRYVCGFDTRSESFTNLRDNFMIETTCVTGFAYCSVKDIADNLDRYLNGFKQIQRIVLEIPTNDYVVIRSGLTR